jgi:hypothetical protein
VVFDFLEALAECYHQMLVDHWKGPGTITTGIPGQDQTPQLKRRWK